MKTQDAQVKDYFSLLKPGVMTLIVFTGVTGIFLASGNQHPIISFIVLLSISMASGGAAAINMWYDKDIDKIMTRTQKRALPLGKIEPDDALVLGIILCVLASLIIFIATNFIAAFFLSLASLFYIYIYTMLLKRRTAQNIVIGGAAGAFPPIISYVSITGDLTLEAFMLFVIIFLWTPPHFWALALFRNKDYEKAKIPMLPVVKGIDYTITNIIIYTILLIISTYLLIIFSTKLGLIYLIIATLSNMQFLRLALKLKNTKNESDSLTLFKYSILYLFIIYSAIILDCLI